MQVTPKATHKADSIFFQTRVDGCSWKQIPPTPERRGRTAENIGQRDDISTSAVIDQSLAPDRPPFLPDATAGWPETSTPLICCSNFFALLPSLLLHCCILGLLLPLSALGVVS